MRAPLCYYCVSSDMSGKQQGRLSLRRNFSWILVGSMVENGSKWAMFILLTKLTSPEEVGSFSLALAVTTPITILTQLQLRAALITDAGEEHPFGAYRALRLISVVVSMLIVGAVGVGLYGVGYTGALIAMVGLSQVMTSLRDIWMGLSQKQERMDVTATGNMIDGFASLVLFAALLVAIGDVLWAVGGMVVARLATLFFYDMPHARATMDDGQSDALVWHRPALVRLFWKVLPLGLTTALVSLNSNIPQYFNEEYLGRENVAFFAAIFYFVLAAWLVVASLGRAASPRLARLYRSADRRRFSALLWKLLAISAGLGLVCILGFALFGEHFLRIAYSEEYAAHADILIVLMFAGGLRFINATLGVAMTAARYFKIQPLVYGAVTVTTVLACWEFIPAYGLLGAAWAAVAVAMVNVLCSAVVVVHVVLTMPAGAAPSPPAAPRDLP